MSVCALLLLGGPFAWAQRDRTFFQASRALGMGDAFTAHDVGFEAVYYNPAGIARRTATQLKIIDIEGTLSSDSLSLLNNTLSSTAQMAKITEYVADHPGKTYTMGLNFLPQFLVRNFSIGLLGRFQSEAYVSQADRVMDFYAYSDMAVYAHYGFSLFGGIIKLGAGVKLLDRAELNRSYTRAEYEGSGLKFNDEWQEGTGIGYDAGMLLIIPVVFLPTFGLSVQEIGDTLLKEDDMFFSSAPNNGAPLPLRQKVNAGYAMTVKHDRGSSSTLAFDLKDLAHLSDYAIEHFHAGYELNMNESFFLRAGLNQGKFWTAGLGLYLAGNGLELSSWGEQIRSPVAGLSRAERKWIGRYVIKF